MADHAQVIKAIQGMDKGMLQSKKFVGFMVIETTWKALMAYGIYTGLDSSVLLAMTAAAGTAETAFLGAVAWHDKHVKSAKMAALGNGGSNGASGEPADGG